MPFVPINSKTSASEKRIAAQISGNGDNSKDKAPSKRTRIADKKGTSKPKTRVKPPCPSMNLKTLRQQKLSAPSSSPVPQPPPSAPQSSPAPQPPKAAPSSSLASQLSRSAPPSSSAPQQKPQSPSPRASPPPIVAAIRAKEALEEMFDFRPPFGTSVVMYLHALLAALPPAFHRDAIEEDGWPSAEAVVEALQPKAMLSGIPASPNSYVHRAWTLWNQFDTAMSFVARASQDPKITTRGGSRGRKNKTPYGVI